MHENVFPGGMPVEGKRGNYIALAVTLAALGALLRSLLDAVIENRVPNEREALLRCAEELQTEKIPDAEPPL